MECQHHNAPAKTLLDMTLPNPATTLEAWVREQPGGFMHAGLHISDSIDDLGVHWRASEVLEAGTRYVAITLMTPPAKVNAHSLTPVQDHHNTAHHCSVIPERLGRRPVSRLQGA